MADLHGLAQALKQLDDQLVNCMRCGMCQAVCPVFAQTGRETDVTRGKLALLEGLADELIKDPDAVNDTLNRCLMCGTCQANCPSGVKVLDIFFQARAILTGYYGLSPVKKAIFRGMLANPRLFNALSFIGARFQFLFTKKADALLGSSCARFQAPLIADRHFNTLAATSLHARTGSLNTPAGTSGLRAAFFPGCVVDKMYPSVGLAVIKALNHHGVGVYLPANQACCGIPVLSSGDRQGFNRLVEQNVKLFADADCAALVTPCASCTATIKELWPEFYDGSADIGAELRKLAEKTMDISEFLVDRCGVTVFEPVHGASVTYHDPCHLKNSLGITRQPRQLLESAGAELHEMEDAGTCCGCGGTFNIYHYEMSKKIGSHKADCIVTSGASTVTTSCPACMMQITDLLSRRQSGIGVRHVVEVYADRL